MPRLRKRTAFLLLVFSAGFVIPVFSTAQDRLKTYPGYEHYQKMMKEMEGAAKLGILQQPAWKDGGKALEYSKDGKIWRFDLKTKKTTELGPAQPPAKPQGYGSPPGAPERGRQFAEAISPDKKLKAFYRDHNLWLSDADGKNEFAVTTEGNEKARLKCGSASWVYGEELDQNSAIWWSPDSRKIAYYRFDESKVPDYFIQLDQTKLYSKADIEAYPKAGQPNPVADLFTFDLAAKTITQVDVRDGKPFDDAVVGHYAYSVSWSADGKELLFNRTNRRQNIMEFVAADPGTGRCRVIVREEWPASWTENSPSLVYLKDKRRFIWASERTGFRNLYLYDLGGKLLAALTNHPFEVANIVKVDEEAGFLYYMARDGANHMMMQLHRVRLDGKKDKRLTDPAFNHAVSPEAVSPDGRYFVDSAQTHDQPPVTRLVDAKGKIAAELAKSDLTKFEELGLKKVELIKFKSADGSRDLYGVLSFPSGFDPNKKYPLLVSVYAGPGWSGASERFATPNPITELGFLVASFDTRGSSGWGKKAMDAIYGKLGVVEIDDQAAGVKSLYDRPYINKERVGIWGTSYGGYASALCLLRHPDVFAAACAASAVTSWYQYDSIYTERYMGIPQDNKDGYEAGNAMKYIDNLKGRLMIYYGTADNNVHPTNAMQLIQALQRGGRSFEVQAGPDAGHSGLRTDRMMEFFIENLVLR
ncbi:MAG: S9 family peptidase [Candidatus Aminicenantes bacterium]|nr:S9 family peptidase [Candidatus Aminicenantes bacterium]